MKKTVSLLFFSLLGACSNQDLLPPMMATGQAECSQVPSQPDGMADLCFWLPPFGSLVFGTIESIESSEAPYDDGSCEGINRALVVHLRVDETPWGAETPDAIEIAFGPTQIGNWSPSPIISSNGSINWTTPKEGSNSGALFVGQRLGIHIDKPTDGDLFSSNKFIALSTEGSMRLSTGACDAQVIAPYSSREKFDEDLATCLPAQEVEFSSGRGAAECFDI